MELIDGQVFDGKAVVLDGKHFNRCTFKKTCTLIFEGGEWAESNCIFEPGFQVSLNGAAARTAAFMQRFGIIRPIPMPVPTPIAVPNPPGGIQ